MFIQNDEDIYLLQDGKVLTKLLPKIYTLKYDKPRDSYYLRMLKPNFNLSGAFNISKLEKISNRIVSSYNSELKNLGVLFSGIKGSGKTFQMQHICNNFLSLNIPVITISEAFHGSELEYFLNTLGECVLVFDEFTNIYERELQTKILSLIDGNFTCKRLVLFSTNDYHLLAKEFINRPGRIKYHLKYSSISLEELNEYCSIYLNNTDLIPDIIELYNRHAFVTYDLLKTIVNECNLFPEETFESIKSILNLKRINHVSNSY